MAKKLVLKLIALAAAILLSGLLIGQYHTNVRDDSYLAAVLEKDRLIRNTPSPKIILVGGSNLAFGIDSKAIEDSLGLHVVNMGLYAKLGLKYMLAQVRPYIKPGDVVLVVPEYDQFYGDFANGDNTLNTALLYAPADRIPDFIRSYSIIDVVLRPRVENARRSFLRAFAAAVGKEDMLFPQDTNTVYNRHSFNQYGDAVSHLDKKGLNPDSIFVKPLPPLKDFNRRTLEDLNSIASKAKEEQAHAYFLFPSYIDRSYVINVAAIDSLKRKLAGGMDMPIVGTPKDFVMAGQYFFDTRYHLNREGRDLRTLKMIDVLRAQGRRDGWLH
ncbi:MAG TPA: hypothetical protein VFD22_00745 [Gemmatimonadaceae bacterium]|nr:hypothetical protein [Gemmatimonadaceae bacterium]